MTDFISYGKQWIDEADIHAVVETLKSDFLTQGPKVEEFEKAICRYTGAKYCVAVSNGTAALHLAVAALEIEKECEGITTPVTFVASANCLLYNDLKPVFADIDQKTYNIDPIEIEKKITDKTRVIIAVDFAGQPADLKLIHRLAKKNDIYIVEDAAHALGSKYKDGSRVGSCKYSDITTFSFHPVKTITTGEGGTITTNSKEIYQKLLLLRSHGITKNQENLSKNPGPWYSEMQKLGFNFRMTDIQSSLGLSQLKKIDQFAERRREIVCKYNEAYSRLNDCITPYEEKGLYSVFHLYVLQIDFSKIGKSRKEVMESLKENNIGTQVHYIPVHLQPYYQKKYGHKRGGFPIAESYYKKCLSLPLYPKMSNEDVSRVIEAINGVLNER